MAQIPGKNYISFFKIVFRESKGYLGLMTRNSFTGVIRSKYFKYPEELDLVPDFINKHRSTSDIWFCAQLLLKPKRDKINIGNCITVWSDLDKCIPEKLLVQPSIVVESSPNKYQGIWVLEEEVSGVQAEEISKRIAYHHKDDGADISGWDLTQLLRVPFTMNFKYSTTPVVHLREVSQTRFSVSDFNVYLDLKKDLNLETPVPNISGINAKALVKDAKHPYLTTLFQVTPKEDWSSALWNLERTCFEQGMTAAEVFAVVKSSACNKYERDKRTDLQLWHEVLKAENISKSTKIEIDVWEIELLTEEEREEVQNNKTLIEEYINWAKAATDAPSVFHEGCAFIILSSLLSGNLVLPTSFGDVYVNLWVIILADSTLARKSTTMSMAVKMIKDIDDSILLANDGTIEGLLSELQKRPNKSSLFHRDEISGFLETVIKKDYLSGMLEWITQLYDGTSIKRILRKETITVAEPRFLFLTGGVLSRVDELLGYQHITSGFIPRFIVIRAKADLTKYRPLGPPKDIRQNNKYNIIKKFRDIYGFYNRTRLTKVDETIIPEQTIFHAELTPEAWMLYAEYEVRFLKAAQTTSLEAIYSPLFQRLCVSGLKMAVLIAALRKTEHILVTVKDLKHAFFYVEKFGKSSVELVQNIGKSASERTIAMCLDFVQSFPDGVHRSTFYLRMKLADPTGKLVLDTLKKRGLISIQGARISPIYPTKVVNRKEV